MARMRVLVERNRLGADYGSRSLDRKLIVLVRRYQMEWRPRRSDIDLLNVEDGS